MKNKCIVDILQEQDFTFIKKTEENKISLLSRKLNFRCMLQVSAGHTSTHFYDAMIRLRECVVQNWKEMRRLFRSMDRDNQGAIPSLDFRYVLRQFSVNLEEDEFFHLLSYYDKNLNGMIAYNDFIKAYLQNPWGTAILGT